MMALRRYPATRTFDPDEAFDSIRKRNPGSRNLYHDTHNSRRFRFAANHVTLGGVSIVSGASTGYGLEIAPDGIVRVAMPTRGWMALQRGAKRVVVEPQSPASFMTTGPMSVHFPAPYCGFVASVRKELLQGALPLFDCDKTVDELLDANFGRTNCQGFRGLIEEVRHVARRLDDDPEHLLALDSFRASYGESLLLRVANVIAGLSGSSGQGESVDAPSLRRCIEYIHGGISGTVSLQSMARHAGVSLRTAQALFRRHLDCTITDYIRQVRLKHAHDALLRAGEQDSVTSVALGAGFTHLSDFAAAYHVAFGELPSETLRRARRLG